MTPKVDPNVSRRASRRSAVDTDWYLTRSHWRKNKDGASVVSAQRPAYAYPPTVTSLARSVIILRNGQWHVEFHDDFDAAKDHVEQYLKKKGWWRS